MGKEILKFGDTYLYKSPIFEKDVDIINVLVSSDDQDFFWCKKI